VVVVLAVVAAAAVVEAVVALIIISSSSKRKWSNKLLDEDLTPNLQVALLLLLLNGIIWNIEMKLVLQNWGGKS